MSSVVLAVEGLQIQLAGRSLVRDVSFELRSGQVLGIIGESGSGKSLTCRSLLGLLPNAQVQGRIHFAGQELIRLPSQEMRRIRGAGIGIILQNPVSYFNPIATIGQQFTETLRTHRSLSQATANTIAAKQLYAVGLTTPDRILKQYPFQLSGGMLQRVMIAIAVALKPQVLIADEPTTALDVITQIQILQTLKQLQQQTQCALLLVTHDLGVMAQMADQVAVMRDGEFLEQCNVTELFDRPQHDYTRSLLAARLKGGRA